MNSEKIINILLDGAYLEDFKLHHPSFRKGWRKMSIGNISFIAAENKLKKIGKQIKYENGKYFL